MFRLLGFCGTQQLDGLLVVFTLVFQEAEIVVYIKLVCLQGTGNHHAFVGILIALELHGCQGMAQGYMKLGDLRVARGEVDQDFVGPEAFLPGTLLEMYVGHGKQGVGILGIRGQLLFGLLHKRGSILVAFPGRPLSTAGIRVAHSQSNRQ